MTNRLQYLFAAYMNRSASVAERQELWELIRQPIHEEEAKAIIGEAMEDPDSTYEMSQEAAELVFRRVIPAIPARIHFLRRGWFRYAAAAAVIVLLGGAALWWGLSNKTEKPSNAAVAIVTGDIAPGTNKAILTVGNNKPIDLSNNKTGIAVGVAITYNDGERIADAGQTLQLVTPRGGQYQAVLPDGSKVWLNAASSIRFPSKFNGARREVEVGGEVYLEVAQNAKQPFYVHTRKTSIQVLGTSFNVNAYGDEEAEKTTLVEGSVKVSSGKNDDAVLRPGQQSVQKDNALKVVDGVNIEQTIAWKNGIFNFTGKTFDLFMKDIERWYDVGVRYEGVMPASRMKGEMDRGVQLSGVIRFLKESGLKVRLEDRTLIIGGK